MSNKEKGFKPEMTVTIRMRKEMYEKLKKTSYLIDQPVSQIIRSGIDLILSKQKDLTNR